jgi:hypothetical protein
MLAPRWAPLRRRRREAARERVAERARDQHRRSIVVTETRERSVVICVIDQPSSSSCHVAPRCLPAACAHGACRVRDACGTPFRERAVRLVRARDDPRWIQDRSHSHPPPLSSFSARQGPPTLPLPPCSGATRRALRPPLRRAAASCAACAQRARGRLRATPSRCCAPPPPAAGATPRRPARRSLAQRWRRCCLTEA